ncbi:FlgD immunoglobulin-like domain containing protein [Marispirochaeta aestuarii]|uniref:FlgD immunoglobulin-like domain containing protein n=1 Tax=Marispirochaeta aestuarii TaxID=1963862 RepID=UPI001E5E0B7D|nr:FlgD immunoglobulin-like domain containing protein [Marispirochaeta aestuarii]
MDINGAVLASLGTVTATADSDDNDPTHDLQVGANVGGTTVTFQTGGAGTNGSVVVDGNSLNSVGQTVFQTAASVELGANVLTDGGAISFAGTATAVNLVGADRTIDTTNAGSTLTGGNIDFTTLGIEDDGGNEYALTLNAGSGGVISLASVGQVDTIDTLIFTDALEVRLSGAIDVSGAIDFTNGNDITLTAAAVSITSSAGGIDFTGAPVDSAAGNTYALTLTANSGTVGLSATGQADALSTLTVSAGTVGYSGAVTATGLIDIDGVADNLMTIGQTVTSTAGNIDIDNLGAVTVGAALTANGTAAVSADTNDTGTEDLTINGGNVIGTTATLESGSAAGSGSDVVITTVHNKTTGNIVVNDGASLVLNANLVADTAAGSDITVAAGIPLHVDTSATVSAADTVTVNESISGVNGGEALNIDGATVNLPLVNATGGALLAGLDVDATTVANLNGDISTNGEVNFAGSLATNLQGNVTVTTSNDNIVFDGTTLTDSVAATLEIDTVGGGLETVSFGSVSLDNAGSALTITSASNISLNGIMTVDGNIDLDGADAGDSISLAGTSAITSTNGSIDLADGDLNGNDVNINGNQTLSVTADSGTVRLAGVGNSTAVSRITVSGDVVILEGAIVSSGGASPAVSISEAGVAGDPLTIDGTITATGDNIVISGTGAVDINGAVLASLGTVTATADSDDNDPTHDLQVGANVGGTTVTFQTGGAGTNGSVVVDGNSLNSVGQTVFQTAASVELGANVLTDGGAISFAGTATAVNLVGADRTIDTTNAGSTLTGGNIDFTTLGIEDDGGNEYALTLNAGSGGVISLASVGQVDTIDTLIFTDALEVRLSGAIDVSGAIDFTNGNDITLTAAAVSITSSAGGIDFTGAPVDSAAGNTYALTLTANSGTVGLSATGQADALSTLTVSAGTVGYSGAVTATGLIDIDGVADNLMTIGQTVTSTAGNIDIDNLGAVTVGAALTANGTAAVSADTNDTGTEDLTINGGNVIGTTATLESGSAAGSGSDVVITTVQNNTAGSIVVNAGASLVLNANLVADTAAGSDITVAAGIPLHVDTSATVSAADTVTVNESISGVNGGEALNIDGATVNLPLVNATGGALLAGLDVDATTVANLNGDISTNGEVNFAGSLATNLPGNVTVTTSNDNIVFDGTTLTDSVAATLEIDTVGGGLETVSFGTVTLDNGGSALTITSASNISLNGIMTVDGNIDFSGTDAGDNASLLSNSVITSTNGNVDSSGLNLNGAYSLDIDGADVSVASIGNVTRLTAIDFDAVGTLTLGGVLIQTEGGNVDVTGSTDIEVSANLTIDTEGGDDGNAGSVLFAAGAAIDSAGTNSLAIDTTTGAAFTYGDIVLGLVGATDPLSSLLVEGHIITANGVGTVGTPGVTGQITMDADDDGTATPGQLILAGANYYSGSLQNYDGGSNGILLPVANVNKRFVTDANNINFQSTTFMYESVAGINTLFLQPSGNMVFAMDLHVFAPNKTIDVIAGSTLSAQNLVLYSGQLGVSNVALNINQDLVFLGAAYADTDPDTGIANLFEYDHPVRTADGSYPGNILANPNVALYGPAGEGAAGIRLGNFPGLGIGPSEATYSGGLASLNSAILTVGGNFYLNGADMNSGAFSLNIPNNADSSAAFAEAYNATVADSTASGGWVAAAEATDGLGNTQWDFTAPDIVQAYTISDYEIFIEFSEALENSNNEIGQILDADLIFVNAAPTQDFTAVRLSDASAADLGALAAGTESRYFIFRNGNTTWRTDAHGSTVTQADDYNDFTAAPPAAGQATSTNYLGQNPGNIVPDIYIVKANGTSYITLLDEHKNRVVHRVGGNQYTETLDRCDPVLVKLMAGRQGATGDNRDYHNYFRLQYSEDVQIGSLDPETVPHTNQRAQTTLGAGDYGGAADGLGTVSVNGFFSYAGDLDTDSTDGLPGESLEMFDGHELFIYAGGYNNGTIYPGYLLQADDPVSLGVVPAVLAHPNIRDKTDGPSGNGNPLNTGASLQDDPLTGGIDEREIYLDPASSFAGWDVVKPKIAPFPDSTTPTASEIIVRDSGGNTIIDTIELHVLDDESASWDSSADHPDGVTGTPSEPWKGIRDSSVTAAALTAFGLDNSASGIVDNIPSPVFSSTVNDTSLFGTVANPSLDDPYFSVSFAENRGFTELDQLYLTYNPSSADQYVTDLAGNVLSSITSTMCLERTPPRILYSLAVPGDDKIYLKFSEPVYQTAGNPVSGDPITPADFAFVPPASYTINSVEVLSTELDGAKELYLHLDSPLDMEEIVDFPANGYGMTANLEDQFSNAAATEAVRLSSLGIGVVSPVWASDRLHQDNTFGTNFSTVREFDGSGKIMDTDFTLEARILPTVAAADTMNLIYDVNPLPVTLAGPGNLWLPTIITEFNGVANGDVRYVSSFGGVGALRDYLVPGGDPEIVSGADLEFIFRLGPLYCVRSLDPEDPRRIAPWILPIRDISRQTGGVTILGNVINPGDGERAVLSYELSESGMVTITVFGLDGDVVDIIQRGNQAAGEHTATWDGRNRGGREVARGIYFIRVVAPGIDEYRKVMVVK